MNSRKLNHTGILTTIKAKENGPLRLDRFGDCISQSLMASAIFSESSRMSSVSGGISSSNCFKVVGSKGWWGGISVAFISFIWNVSNQERIDGKPRKTTAGVGAKAFVWKRPAMLFITATLLSKSISWISSSLNTLSGHARRSASRKISLTGDGCVDQISVAFPLIITLKLN